jgi:thiol-disulfide isomerase/thioredoxin
MSNLPHKHFYLSNTIKYNQFDNSTPEGYNSNDNKQIYELFSSPTENAFVMFYAPWCGHCKSSKPHVQSLFNGIACEYSDYSKGNFQKHNNTAIVMVNGDEHPEITQKFNIDGYPTFKLFKNVKDRNSLQSSQIDDYNGNRDKQSFTQYLLE